ncbi:hypothetical protein BAX51_00805 [Mycoplasmoides gallisepticum]|uniref:Secreted protein n=1 Tax=Mycoplasmoides gallisepticum TaxID=2096 RepID=A0AB36DT47_MYCGL|nr:hypothetical protein BAY36_00880 [Mycoplasmoides gallisepticum]OBU79028.1 hypothetical protein BAY37_03000 [Mycoplasmoides gallisepticum]OBU80249.1 hypothetical protein BAX52_02255 [Mycoplasmoides gallisepticum]OBU81216.1 hypothetical protein BAX51_00805 [Mycoplasmoides gallisepticum]OBU81550.1 hypothetical protein BAX53_00050 [Mycoplasmoides gallisepticum]
MSFLVLISEVRAAFASFNSLSELLSGLVAWVFYCVQLATANVANEPRPNKLKNFKMFFFSRKVKLMNLHIKKHIHQKEYINFDK